MSKQFDNPAIREIVRGSKWFDEVRACFEEVTTFNVEDRLGHDEGCATLVFGEPRVALASLVETLANSVVDASGTCAPSFAFADWLWNYREDLASRRQLFKEHFSILRGYAAQSEERMDCLLDLWIEAFYRTVMANNPGSVSMRGVRVELGDTWRGRLRTVVHFDPWATNEIFNEGQRGGVESFAAGLILAIGQTLGTDEKLFQLRPVQVGFTPEFPPLADDELVHRRVEEIFETKRLARIASAEADRVRAAEEKAASERQSRNRLNTIGQKYRDDVQPQSLDWRSATPDHVRTLVWEHPTSTLAVMFGVSDVAIGKYCRRNGIDKPPRGYWARKGR